MKAYRHMMASRGGIRLLGHRMNKLKTAIVPMLVVAAMVAAAPQAYATPLAPGGNVPAVGFVSPGGTEVANTFINNTCFGPAGTVCDVGASVLIGADTGTLDFYYQVTNESALNDIHRLTGTSFAGFVTDV